MADSDSCVRGGFLLGVEGDAGRKPERTAYRPVHENGSFHGREQGNRQFVHEKDSFHGQEQENRQFVHEKDWFHGQEKGDRKEE